MIKMRINWREIIKILTSTRNNEKIAAATKTLNLLFWKRIFLISRSFLLSLCMPKETELLQPIIVLPGWAIFVHFFYLFIYFYFYSFIFLTQQKAVSYWLGSTRCCLNVRREQSPAEESVTFNQGFYTFLLQ